MSNPWIVAVGVALSALAGGHSEAQACTSAVVAPAASEEGRPLLWKNRDSKAQHNIVILGEDGKYRYVGVANAGDDSGREVWMGVNERGLAVINTAVDDLALPGLPVDGEGRLLKTLLQSCTTVGDVERFLEATNRGGRDTNAHLGVIDYAGAATFFEVAQERYVKHDTSDATMAPQGFIVRTNFGLTAPPDKGGGYLRKNRAERLFSEWRARHKLTSAFILSGPSIDVANELTGLDPRVKAPPTPFMASTDWISRYSSVSVMVVEGARPPEPAWASVMWVGLGQPLTALAIPVWPVPQSLGLLVKDEPQAGLEKLADQIRLVLYPHQRGELVEYVDAVKALAVRRILDEEQQKIFTLVAGERAKLVPGRTLTPAALARITARAAELAEAGLRRAVASL